MALTKDQIRDKVLSNVGKHWVMNILLLLLERQTAAEQSSENTTESNGIGFSGMDGHYGTSVAKAIKARGTITDAEYRAWIKESRGYPKICKYWRQINDEIEKKEKAKAA